MAPARNFIVNRSSGRRPRKGGSDPGDEILVIGASSSPFGDLYHRFLWMSWPQTLAVLVLCYLLLNAGFAGAYLFGGGVQGARPGSLTDAFYFSIQTMGTIGYGAMFPVSQLANTLVTAESITGMLVTALFTGLVFAKFSRSTARAVFTEQAVIAPMDGVPTLMFRVGNQRGNLILEATLRLTMMRTELTREGHTFYRMYDLPLTRERSPALSRSWTAMHRITDASPLFGCTPEGLAEREVELIVTLVGTDDTSLQPVHARHRYTEHDIIFGARHADILSEGADGRMVLDLHKFHLLQPSEPTAEFPYPPAS
jgi:inward rectifier potassium channel